MLSKYTELCVCVCTCLNSGQERKPSWSVSHLLKAASTLSSSTSRLPASSTPGLRPVEARQHSRLCWGHKWGIITSLMDIFPITKLTICTYKVKVGTSYNSLSLLAETYSWYKSVFTYVSYIMYQMYHKIWICTQLLITKTHFKFKEIKFCITALHPFSIRILIFAVAKILFPF